MLDGLSRAQKQHCQGQNEDQEGKGHGRGTVWVAATLTRLLRRERFLEFHLSINPNELDSEGAFFVNGGVTKGLQAKFRRWEVCKTFKSQCQWPKFCM